MLTSDEENFLKTIPASKKVSIKPFDPRIKDISKNLILDIKNVCSDLEIIHMGASGLEISGQNDIDIYALANPIDFDKYLPALTKLLGEPLHSHKSFVEWKFFKEGFEVEFYLTDPDSSSMQRQIKVFNILKSTPKLLEEYKNMKESMNGKSFRDYQRKKYEFYAKILNI